MKEEIKDIICKYGLSLRSDGNVAVASYMEKEAKKNILVLKNNKPEIVAALQEMEIEKEERIQKEKEEEAQELKDLKSGKKLIEVKYHDGEYLTGWEAFGQAAKLLKEIGLGKYVSGWGCLVDDKTVKDLGKTFSFPAAQKYVRPINEKKEKAKKDKENKETARIENLKKIAKKTGKKQLVKRFSVECQDPEEECNTDIASTYIYPDGKIATDISHTW
jgi:hypothetical protein